MEYSLQLYRQARRALRESLVPLAQAGHRRVVLCGTGEAAELAYLTLRELGLELAGVVDGDGKRGTFLGLPIQALVDLPRESVDLIIVATFAPAGGLIRALTEQGIPREKIVPLRGI